MNIPIISIIGKPGCGKTTLLEKLIPELKERGYRVGTIKHHSHPGFSIDKPGKDSWRHAQAGSHHVVIAAPDKIASYRLLDRELTLEEVAESMQDVDIILTEGYRSAGMPSLEIVRAETGTDLVSQPAQLVAIASDLDLKTHTPMFNLEDTPAMAEFIIHRFLMGDIDKE